MTQNKKRLRLFIVGESSTDPEKWNEYGVRAIVIAHSPEEAKELLAERASNNVIEVDLDTETPKVLLCEEYHGES